MKTLIDRALNKVQMGGAQYADIRIVDTHMESIRVKTGVVESLNSSESIGFGIWVLMDGACDFSFILGENQINRQCPDPFSKLQSILTVVA